MLGEKDRILFQYWLELNMTGLAFIAAQIHAKDQSRISLAVQWKNTNQINSKMYFKKVYEAKIEKRINTKHYHCSMTPVKLSQCVDNFLMDNLNCSFPWLKTYYGKLPKCWEKQKVYDLSNLIADMANLTGKMYQKMLDYGCIENCETISWIEIKASSVVEDNRNKSRLLTLFPATDFVSF